MAESQIIGLFTTPKQAQQMAEQEYRQQGIQFDQNIPGALAAQRLSTPRGMGAFDPRVEEAQKIESIRKSVPFDVNDQSAYYTQLAQQLINNGLTQAGAQALELAKKARLDEAKIRKAESSTTELSVTSEKSIRDANEAYTSSIGTATKAAELASEFNRKRGTLGSGISAMMGESWKELFGNQDDVTELRKSFTGLTTSAGLRNLPPGAASDTDVALVLRPFPKDTADPDYISRFLTGMAKGAMLDAEYQRFRGNYITQKGNEGGLIDAWKEHYKNLDLEALFAQQGFTLNTGTATGGTDASGAVDWSSL